MDTMLLKQIMGTIAGDELLLLRKQLVESNYLSERSRAVLTNQLVDLAEIRFFCKPFVICEKDVSFSSLLQKIGIVNVCRYFSSFCFLYYAHLLGATRYNGFNTYELLLNGEVHETFVIRSTYHPVLELNDRISSVYPSFDYATVFQLFSNTYQYLKEFLNSLDATYFTFLPMDVSSTREYCCNLLDVGMEMIEKGKIEQSIFKNRVYAQKNTTR